MTNHELARLYVIGLITIFALCTLAGVWWSDFRDMHQGEEE